MSQEITTTNPNQSMLAAPAWSREEADLIRSTLCPGATDGQLALFAHVAKSKGLNPFSNQISMQIRKAKDANGNWSTKPTFVTHIDGYRVKAARTGELAGIDEPEFQDNEDESRPIKARVTVWRFVKGQRVGFTATARWNEFVPDAPGDRMWRKMPYQMLGKVAEAQALRKGFPEELGDLYIKEEMDQAEEIANAVAAAPVVPTAQALNEATKAEPPKKKSFQDQVRGALEMFAAIGFDENQVLLELGRKAVGEITPNDLRTLAKRYDELKQQADIVDGEVSDAPEA